MVTSEPEIQPAPESHNEIQDEANNHEPKNPDIDLEYYGKDKPEPETIEFIQGGVEVVEESCCWLCCCCCFGQGSTSGRRSSAEVGFLTYSFI